TLALTACLYFAGRIQRVGRPQALFVGMLALVVVVLAVARVPQSPAAHLSASSGAEQWSEARVASYVQQGHPVFVYFTADWCLSCKVNETTSIDRDEVRDAFKKAGVKVVAGDWTNGDPAITRFLESQGRAGVPLYLWYAPGKPVEQLPQVLTPAMLISRAQSR
ncbi:MAG TPA: thioredoxin family protein, partial [Sphingomicrobium sp.]|nr:thioredoxin family protein [Sphingomicrobium sp.]